MERGTWRATVHGVTKESDATEQLSAHIKWICVCVCVCARTRVCARTHTHTYPFYDL